MRRAERQVALVIGVGAAVAAFVVLTVANPASLSPTDNQPSSGTGAALVLVSGVLAVAIASWLLRRRPR